MFNEILKEKPDDSFAYYYLGNLYYYLGQKEAGLTNWKKSVELNPSFAIACRNVGFAYGMKGDWDKAITFYEMAVKANPNDALLFTESDKLYEQATIAESKRLKYMESHLKTVMKHDDAVMRLLTLYNSSAQYDKAIKILTNRHFHLWEGGGQIHQIYVDSHLMKGLNLLNNKHYKEAVLEFDYANQYPINLEVAPSSGGGYEAKTYYLSGIAYEGLNQPDKAKECFEKSANTIFRGSLTDLYYYKVKSLRKLNKFDESDMVLNDMQNQLKRMQKKQIGAYAKFGDANQNSQQSNVLYYAGLIHLLQNDVISAKKEFVKAVQLYPGNIWAKIMNEKSSF